MMLFASALVYAEGSRELLNGDCNNEGDIQIWDNGDPLRQFATWNSDPEYRLNIRVNNGEYIHMGFMQSNEDVWYRLKDPNGNVVLGPVRIANGEPGFVDDCGKIMNGPKSLHGNGAYYDDVTYQSTMDGDYYVEFAINEDPTFYEKRIFEHFDITVSEGMHTEQKGRLWSKAWDLNLRGAANPFYGNFFAYSKDSVVTKFEFNGIEPWGFTISCNSFGASDAGDLEESRKSDYRQNIINAGGRPSAPEYPLFLNEPDQYEFPNGTFGVIDSFKTDLSNTNCIEVWVNKEGQVEAVLGFANGSEIIMVENVVSGYNCMAWNGLDGNEDPVQAHDTIWVTLKYTNGITHLPLMDVENHDNGFTVELVRPTTKPNGTPVPDPLIFWNDVLLSDPGNSLDEITNLDGTGPESHRWKDRGTDNSNPEVINTWWYSSVEEQSFTVIYPKLLNIELASFTGEYRNYGTHLQWQSSVEEQADYFTVERSNDGLHFVDIGHVSAYQRPSTYDYTDHENHDGREIYYRLRMVDENGTAEHSKVITIVPGRDANIELRWDASRHQFMARSLQYFAFRYSVTDLTGRTMHQGTATTNQLILLSELQAGAYVIRLNVKGEARLEQFKVFLH